MFVVYGLSLIFFTAIPIAIRHQRKKATFEQEENKRKATMAFKIELLDQLHAFSLDVLPESEREKVGKEIFYLKETLINEDLDMKELKTIQGIINELFHPELPEEEEA